MENQTNTPKKKNRIIQNHSFTPCTSIPLMPINPNFFYQENTEFNYSKSPDFHKIRLKKKLEWTKEEDDNIRRFVHEYGTKNWKTLSEIYPGKTAKQYREHYYNCLETNVLKKIDFTPDEDEKIISFVNANGRKFAKLSKLMPGRTETSIKNRFYFISKHNFQKMKNNEKKENTLLSDISGTMTSQQNTNSIDENKLNETNQSVEDNDSENKTDFDFIFQFDPFDDENLFN